MQKRFYENEIKRAATIDELVWIETDYKQDSTLPCDDLLRLCQQSAAKRYDLELTGQKYHRAKKPAWR